MPGIKISGLQQAGALTGEELIVLVQPNTPPRSNAKDSLSNTFNQLSPVTSVNAKTGVVVLTASDIGALAPGDNISTLVNDVGYITGGSQPAHHVYIGPESGPNATPGFRALVASDIPALPYLSANQAITLSGAVTGSGTTAITTTLANNIVGNTKLRDSQGFSVIGKTDTGTGDPSDIVASNDGDILRRSGSNLAFGSIGIGSITMSTNRILGRTTASSGPVEEIQVQNGLAFESGSLKLGGALSESVTSLSSSTNDKEFNVFLGGPSSANQARFSVVAHANVSNTVVSFSALQTNGDSVANLTVTATGQVSMSNDSGKVLGISSTGVQITVGSDATGDTYYRNSLGRLARVPIGSEGQVYSISGGLPTWSTLPTGSGTVTNVSSGNLSPLFNVSVATATTTPAFSFTAISQSQRLFYASPVSSSGVPSFRAIDFLDVPRASKEISGSYTILASDLGKILYTTATTTVTLPNGFDTNFEVAVVRGAGSGLVTINAQTALFTINSENTLAYEGAAAVFTHKGSNIWYGMGALGALSVSGSVTNFSALDLSPLFTVSVSAPTSTPELSFTLSSQSQNLVFASPDGSSGTPDFRALLDTDLPNVTITTVPNTNYTPSELDNKKILYFDTASDISFNLPQGSALPVGWSTVVWRSTTGGAITFVPQGTATFEGAGSVMNFTKTSVVIVHKGNGVYLASGAIGDFDSGGSGGGHIIKNGATELSAKDYLNFSSGFTVTNDSTDTHVKLGGPLTGNTTISGDNGQHYFMVGGVSSFVAGTPNGNQFMADSGQTTMSSGVNVIGASSSGSLYMLHQDTSRSLIFDGDGVKLTLGSDAIGDMYYRNSSGVFTRLPNVATGSALISTGVNTAPGYGKIGLTTHVTGTLPVANGGTGLINYAQGDILYASVANTLSRLVKGTANQILGMNSAATIPEYKTVSNGLTSASGTLKLGGNLTGNTSINTNGSTLEFGTFATNRSRYIQTDNTILVSSGGAAAAALHVQSGSGLYIANMGYIHSGGGLSSQIQISSTEMLVADSFNSKGLVYAADYSSNFSTRSLTDVGYVLGTKTYTGKQTHTPTGSVAGINVGSRTADPSSPVNGDLYYNSTADELRARIDGAWVALGSGGGGDGQGVTSVTLTQPSAGITISNSGVAITTTGTRTFSLANDLAALEGLGSTGIAVRTASDTWAQRTITSGTGIAVSNGSGVSGNPQISLSHLGIQSLTSPGSDRIMFWDQSAASMQWLSIGSGLTLSGTTLSASGGGSGTVTSVGITPPASGITVSGSPVTSSGNITLALNNDLLALENLGSTGFAVRTANNTWAQRTLGAGTGITITNNNGVSGNPSVAIDSGYISSGTHDTQLVDSTGPVSDIVLYDTAWMKVGDIITVSGRMSYTTSTAGTVQIDISIPQNASTAAAIGGGVVHSNSGAGSSSGWIVLGSTYARINIPNFGGGAASIVTYVFQYIVS